MKKIILALATVFMLTFAAYSQSNEPVTEYTSEWLAGWRTDLGFGLASPLKLIYVDYEKSYGIAPQADVFFIAEKPSGFSFFVEAEAGLLLSRELSIGDGFGIYFDVNVLGGIGYNFLHSTKRHSLVLSAVGGLDFIQFKTSHNSNGYKITSDNSMFNFELGVDLFYRVLLGQTFSLYAGCTGLAGIGFVSAKGTKKDLFTGWEKTDYSSSAFSYIFSLNPKLGFMYRF